MRFILALVCCIAVVTQPSFAAPVDVGTAKLAWSPGPDSPQIALALSQNDWTQRGLTVQSTSFPTGRESLEALIGGQVDFAEMAEFPVVVGAMQQKQFHVIAQIARYRGNRVVLTSAMPLKGLANRKVGTTLGTNANYQTDFVLQRAGVTATIVNVAPPDLVPALARGDIDAAVMFPSFFPLAKKVLGDRYHEIRTPEYLTTSLIVATNDVIDKHPERVKAFLSGLLAANRAAASNRAAAAAAVSTAIGSVASPDAILDLWNEYTFDVSLDQNVLTLLLKEGAWVHDKGLVRGDAPTEQLLRSYIDAEPLRALAPRNVPLH